MAYEIPPPLQHKEKILFGLTFSQLAYALPTALIILFIILKSPFSIEVSFAISLTLGAIASFFMFLDGKNKIKNYYLHVTHQNITINSEKLKSIIDIKEISDNITHTKKEKIAILEVTPINFSIKTEKEQEAILTSFRKLLNSLDFPIQIHISSSPINIDKHLEHVKKTTTKEYYESYATFMTQTLEKNNTHNRKFYIIITETTDITLQTTICIEKIKQMGLKVNQLNNSQLESLFFAYLANKKKKNIKQGEVIEDYMHFLLAPENITFHHDYFEVNNTFCKVIAVTGYPQAVEKGFLDKIISSGDAYDISIFIEPFPIESTMIYLNNELQKQQSDLYAEAKKGIVNYSLEIKKTSTRKVLEEIQKGQQKLFHVSLYFMAKGKSKEEMEMLASKIKADVDSLLMQSKTPTFQMLAAYTSLLPLNRDILKIKRNIHTQGLSAFFPFSSPFFDGESSGVFLGMNKNNIPYIKDIFNLTNANGLILATSGAGKSYFTKLLLSRQYLSGCDIIIIDPQSEYLGITQHYDGEVITISKDSTTIINPLDLMGHEYIEKRLSLMDVFTIMFGDLTEIQKAILDKAVDLTYARFDISAKRWQAKQAPLMQDLYDELARMEKKCAPQERVTYRALLNRLGMYTSSGVFSFLNRQTNIDFSKNFVCFNIGAMPKQVKPVVMYLVLDYVYMRMKQSLRKKLLVIDEAWSLLQTAEESSYIFEIVKTCRKYHLGLLMITQDVADLVGSKAGHAVLANSSYSFLLRQKPAVIDHVAKVFNLSKREKEYLVSAESGAGIFILENEHQELTVIASEDEHKVITTNPAELVEKVVTVEPVEKIELDLEQAVYRVDSLSEKEQFFLAQQGYQGAKFHGVTKDRPREYLVKLNGPEGVQHTYCVNMIVQELLKHTDKIQVNATEKPDIVFYNKVGEEIVIEVETGIKAKFASKKSYHNKKFSTLRETYGERCYVFLINKNLKKSYLRHKLPLLFRLDIVRFVELHFKGQKNATIVQNFNSTK